MAMIRRFEPYAGGLIFSKIFVESVSITATGVYIPRHQPMTARRFSFLSTMGGLYCSLTNRPARSILFHNLRFYANLLEGWLWDNLFFPSIQIVVIHKKGGSSH